MFLSSLEPLRFLTMGTRHTGLCSEREAQASHEWDASAEQSPAWRGQGPAVRRGGGNVREWLFIHFTPSAKQIHSEQETQLFLHRERGRRTGCVCTHAFA